MNSLNDPFDVTLKDGSRVEAALLDDPFSGEGGLAAARKRLVEVINKDAGAVFSCQGQTAKRAREILEQVLGRSDEKAPTREAIPVDWEETTGDLPTVSANDLTPIDDEEWLWDDVVNGD